MILLGAASLFFSSCKKDEDTDAPVITLLGDNPYIINSIGGSFAEQGYTASDNEDGDVTARVVVDASELDENTKGTYDVHYSVTDDAGNAADVHREVIVKNSADIYAGTYATLIQCPGLADYNYTETIGTSSTIDNRIIFGKFGNYAGAENKVYANISGSNVSMPAQTYNVGAPLADRTFTGTGNIVTSGGVTTMTLTVTESIPGQSALICTYTFTK